MLYSISIILIVAMVLGWFCTKVKIPSLLGMIFTGIILGPYALNFIDSSILNISPDIRKIALIIILMRAGLSLDINDLKRFKRPAILMCFVPACFEIVAMVIIAPIFLGVSYLEAAIMGGAVAAVSPAVIVPKMIKIMKEGYGKEKSIPQLILAGASVDDVFVIVLFSSFIELSKGVDVSFYSFLKIPISIILGILIGLVVGRLLSKYFSKVHIRDTVKVLIILCSAFILSALEDSMSSFKLISFSSMISVMCIGISIQKNKNILSKRLSEKFSKLWVVAEIFLFVLVGATVNLKYISYAGYKAVLLIFIVLIFRMLGVFICFARTNLTIKEKIFSMIAYTPKATVQAAIGSIPLSMGLGCGDIVLAVAVLAIIITAPLGAFVIDITYKRLLDI